eukprot:6188622-Pleurochrysis_carterae.AAC.1
MRLNLPEQTPRRILSGSSDKHNINHAPNRRADCVVAPAGQGSAFMRMSDQIRLRPRARHTSSTSLPRRANEADATGSCETPPGPNDLAHSWALARVEWCERSGRGST